MKFIKNMLKLHPQHLQEYVDLGIKVYKMTLLPGKYILEHLLFVQDIDLDTVPGNRAHQELAQLFEKHEEDYDEDFDFSLVKKSMKLCSELQPLKSIQLPSWRLKNDLEQAQKDLGREVEVKGKIFFETVPENADYLTKDFQQIKDHNESTSMPSREEIKEQAKSLAEQLEEVLKGTEYDFLHFEKMNEEAKACIEKHCTPKYYDPKADGPFKREKIKF